MEALTNFNYKQPSLPVFVRHHSRPSFSTPISSISFNTQFSRPSPPKSFSFKIRSSSSSNSSSMADNSIFQAKPITVKPIFLLKTPLSIAVAATAIFFSGFFYRSLTARAEPAAPPMVETTEKGEDVSFSEEREKKLEEAVAANPNNVEALKSLMEARIKNKKPAEAVEVLNRLIELEPEDDEWPLLRCHMYTYMGELEMAKEGFEDIIAKDPLRVEAFHGLVMSVSQGKSDGKKMEEITMRIAEATERCKKEKKKEEMRDFKLLMAQIRVIEGNYVEALNVYQDLVKEEPRDFRPYLCQGIIYTLLRKKDEAQKQFDKYKRLVPKGHPYAKYFDENMLATKESKAKPGNNHNYSQQYLLDDFL